ncbi:MAG: type III toxin-antitoxin system ToxN/AbiQ family toxin [Butyrivibrio sp.]|uniref:type III toxin-antitoxin system ToxN/AbiQ family toxin n=1 Tax=Butyrivibrio sp. TaxID=28121 RepID=UPI001B2665BC|nr:type III toxin-antitoxin system ToxN/AbiQ family toxin [Butyrivibrio sp.]MBO6242157.1 type III toxin-antitoxin system ToxN/AbiQ family toxin [Butyrivibrio sp.]
MKISFYYVDSEYVEFLKDTEINARGFTRVPNVEYANRRKFVYGVIMKIGDINYYVPISSYKKAQEDNILIKIEDHKKQVVQGSMRFNYMFPVPKKCLVPVDFKDSQFTEKEKVVLQKEYKACKKLLSQAQKRANKTYERVLAGENEELVKNSCDFSLLEKAYQDYVSKLKKDDGQEVSENSAIMDNKAFDSKRIAAGYAKRPWLHKSVIEQLKMDCGLPQGYKFKKGLDVGCGAGLSTKALRLICDKVTGTDIAESMVEVCNDIYGADTAYSFYVAKAEETKIPNEKYDIVTAAGCINWVDEKKFINNMAEVTADNGLIVIYDFGITDRMLGNDGYTRWYRDEYLRRFPKPPRKEDKWTQSDLIDGFAMEKQTEYSMEYNFTLDEFVDFMLIQSNVNAQIESGSVSSDDVRKWMMKSLSPIFGDGERTLVFYGYSWYVRKL